MTHRRRGSIVKPTSRKLTKSGGDFKSGMKEHIFFIFCLVLCSERIILSCSVICYLPEMEPEIQLDNNDFDHSLFLKNHIILTKRHRRQILTREIY